MPLDPRPYVVQEAGTAQESPSGAVPIALYGAGSGAAPIPDAESIPVTLEGVEGSNLQEVLASLAALIEESRLYGGSSRVE